jgi:hypothetical protein
MGLPAPLTHWGQAMCPALDAPLEWAAARPAATKPDSGARPLTTRPGGPTAWSRMTHLAHEDQFLPPKLNARCRFVAETFAETSANGRDAPRAAAIAGERVLSGEWPRNRRPFDYLAATPFSVDYRMRCRAGRERSLRSGALRKVRQSQDFPPAPSLPDL